MSRATLVAVLVLLVALGALAWRERARESALVRDLEVPLAPGLVEDDVASVRVENVQRGVHLRVERKPDGRWAMTDPMKMDANDGFVAQLVRTIVGRTGTAVPDADPARLGFEPPTAIVDLARADGASVRVEVGALDLDREHAYVRAGGRVLRVYRDLSNTLDVDLEQFKSHVATAFDAREIVEIHRQGRVVLEGRTEATDVTLDALVENGAWRATSPLPGALEPLAMSLLAEGASVVHIERYVDEAGRPLAQFGLDPPLLTFRFETLHGGSCTLRFGLYNNRVTCARDGVPYVWGVEPQTLWLLATPVEDLLDPRVARFARGEIDGVELSSDRAELRLARDAFGWTVAEARPGSRVFGPAERADDGKVADLLGAIESIELSTFVREPPFADAEVTGAIRVRAKGIAAGGRVGGEHVDAAGLVSRRFQRDGDGFVALVRNEALDVARKTSADLRSLDLFRVPEVDLTELRLVGQGKDLRYARDSKGIWRRYGGELEARELRDVLDALVFLRASEHLPAEPRPPLADPIEVSWLDRTNARTTFVVGMLEHHGEPRAVAEVNGRRSLLRSRDLHAKLVEAIERAGG